MLTYGYRESGSGAGRGEEDETHCLVHAEIARELLSSISWISDLVEARHAWCALRAVGECLLCLT